MRNVFMIDISGKVVNYDIALCDALTTVDKDNLSLEFFCPLYDEKPTCKTRRLLKLVPYKYKAYLSRWKRLLKAIELFLNYLIVLTHVLTRKPDVLHFQWFPLLEISSAEYYIVKLLHRISTQTNIILTIHNVYPHDMSPKNKEQYKSRFNKMDKYINRYIVHTASTMNEVEKELKISLCKMDIIPHGIFRPKYTPTRYFDHQGRNIIMYGFNDHYKGADILLDALKSLPRQTASTINVIIAGRTSEDYLKQLQTKADGLNVTFIPRYIDNKDLYKMIDRADYIALPYRKISQSGVLLLALYFRKPLIISDLPSFVETLKGFTSDMFFKAEDPYSMAELIMRYINNQIDVTKELEAINKLNEIYSWDNVASKTNSLYQCLIYS